MAAATFRIGEFDCAVIPDGIASYDVDIFPDAPKELLEPLLKGRLDEHGKLSLPYNPLLVRTGEAVVLIDAGAGLELAAEWNESVGRAVVSLAEAGVAPAEVDIVIITHAHPDHIGGLTNSEHDARVPAFPTAQHYIWKGEWDYFLSDEMKQKDPGDYDLARTRLAPLRDAGRLDLVTVESEVADGIRLIPTPGHTPGHLSVVLSSGDQSAVVVGDAIFPEWSFEHPDWVPVFDSIPKLAVESRRRLLALITETHSTVQSYHIGEIGRVEVAGETFRFLPLTR